MIWVFDFDIASSFSVVAEHWLASVGFLVAATASGVVYLLNIVEGCFSMFGLKNFTVTYN